MVEHGVGAESRVQKTADLIRNTFDELLFYIGPKTRIKLTEYAISVAELRVKSESLAFGSVNAGRELLEEAQAVGERFEAAANAGASASQLEVARAFAEALVCYGEEERRSQRKVAAHFSSVLRLSEPPS